MNSSLLRGGAAAFVVIFNLGYVFHEHVAADFLRRSFGPGVQREAYLIPVIALSFAIYVALLCLAYPVVHGHFAERGGRSKLVAGAILGLFCGFLWDALQGGLIEYATYHVGLAAMLVDSAYHTAEGALAGVIIGALYKPARAAL